MFEVISTNTGRKYNLLNIDYEPCGYRFLLFYKDMLICTFGGYILDKETLKKAVRYADDEMDHMSIITEAFDD